MSDVEFYDDEEELGSAEVADRDYNDTPQLPEQKTVAKVMSTVNLDGSLRKIIRARRSDFVHNLIYLDGKKFDFTGRNYLRIIYDRDDKQILLKTSRQVEKCLISSGYITLANGLEKLITQVKPMEDKVLAMDSCGHQCIDRIVCAENNGIKPCLRITTRLGSKLVVTENHPFRKLQEWADAKDLVVGDKIASLRKQGFFGDKQIPWAGLLGVQVGDGHFYCTQEGCWAVGITKKTPEVLSWIKSLLGSNGFEYKDNYIDPRTGATRITFRLRGIWADLLRSMGLEDKRAHEKTLPDEVFSWDESSTAELIKGLWATDGHCKNVSQSKVDLVYGSASPILIRQIRLLLRKFGIITTQREYKPVGKNHRRAYLIRVITRKSLQIFHDKIGPIPSKPFYIPDVLSNSNLDTLPKEIHDVVLEARKSKGTYWKRDSFQSRGLCIGRSYCPTYEKITKINEYLQDPVLDKILSSDIIWDKIISIEDAGKQETWALETGTQTFLSDFLVNHNTTFLANNLTVTSVVMPYNKALYVSPSHTQTRQFSNEKLRPAIEKSPLIKKYFQDSSISTQVFEKGFTNGSFVFLRSAFRTADRARGISSRILCLDEIQDFQGSEIPVIMECTSHFVDSRTLMAGTPKSHDNPIELYWKSTTQNEWLVPCHSCGKWNFLDEENIAPTVHYLSGKIPPGPVCRRCGKPIHPPEGKWVSFSKGASIQGYRIPQLMVPWICGLYEQWLKLLWKRDNYPYGQFANEVLGLSYDSASKPITRDEIIECCRDYSLWNPMNLNAHVGESKRYQLTAGVDWGEGNDGSERSPTGKLRNASYTVLTIGGYINQKIWRPFLIKRYMGKEVEPDYVVKDIARLCNALGVSLCGVDWGHGWGVNNQLVRILGPKRVVQYQHLPKLKQKMKWDRIGMRYHLHRNFMMSELFFDIKQKFVEFPRWSEFETFAKDILGIYSEYVEYKREIKYDHRPSDPDDFFHSLLYAKLTSDVYLGKSRRFTFDIPDGIGSAGVLSSYSQM